MIFTLLSTYFRSFFVQTLWNFERLQNVGFAFGVAPLLKRANDSRTSYHDALRRHMAVFNTHPYFAPVVMGVVYSKEAARQKHLTGEDPTLTVLKDSMGGAFGAIGDHVIWGTWRPFCAIIALSVGMLVAYPLAGSGSQKPLFDPTTARICAQWWVAGFLGIFNSVHLWLRWRGLQKAIHEGPLVVRWVQSLHLQAWAAQIRRIGLLLAGDHGDGVFRALDGIRNAALDDRGFAGNSDHEALGSSELRSFLSRLRSLGRDDFSWNSLAMTEKFLSFAISLDCMPAPRLSLFKPPVVLNPA